MKRLPFFLVLMLFATGCEQDAFTVDTPYEDMTTLDLSDLDLDLSDWDWEGLQFEQPYFFTYTHDSKLPDASSNMRITFFEDGTYQRYEDVPMDWASYGRWGIRMARIEQLDGTWVTNDMDRLVLTDQEIVHCNCFENGQQVDCPDDYRERLNFGAAEWWKGFEADLDKENGLITIEYEHYREQHRK